MSHTQEKPSLLSQNAKEILAGSFAGVLQVLTGQPFDIVKVRM
jgi:solute carrier family 25 carnitine/acylcarnitine transporter 20/29